MEEQFQYPNIIISEVLTEFSMRELIHNGRFSATLTKEAMFCDPLLAGV